MRSVEQIMALIQSLQATGGLLEQARKSLVEERLSRETSKLRGARTGSRGLMNIRKNLLELTKDNISFLRKSSFLSQTDDRITLSPEAEALVESWKVGDKDTVRAVLVRRILSSPYKAYMGFLQALDSAGGQIEIPSGGSQRLAGSPLRRKLSRFGFKTDLASFFTIRDLFYDLQLVNMNNCVEMQTETIFLVSALMRRGQKNPAFRQSVSLDTIIVYFDRIVKADDFNKALLRAYKNESSRWGRWVSVLKVREDVILHLKISDLAFNSNLLMTIRKGGWQGYVVKTSVGYPASTSERVGYGTRFKSMNMPVTKSGHIIRYLSVEPK